MKKNPWDVDTNNEKKVINSTNNNTNSQSNKSIDELFKTVLKNVKNSSNNGNNAKFFNKNNIKWNKKYTLLIIALVIAVWLSNGIYKVNSDENAVVTYFGKYYETTTPGLHYYIPFPIGKIQKVGVTRINKEEFGFSSSMHGKKTFDEESLMLTGDENIADIDFEVQWRIGNVKDYLFNIKNPQRTIRSATESVMREIVANRQIDDVLANKKLEIELEAKDLLQKILDSYNAGIDIVTVQLLRADPPKEVINAFRDVQTAKADKERKINEAQSYSNDIMPKARGEAEAILQKAEAYKKAVVSKAEGETARFNQLYEEYKLNKDITKKRIYIETMEEVMKNNEKIIIDEKAGGNLIQLLNNNNNTNNIKK